MLRYVLRLRVSAAVVFGSALVAGVMLQYDWFLRKPDDAYGIRYGVVAPLTAVAIFALWVGYSRALRVVVPPAELEAAVRRDAWSFLPLLLTTQAVWNPPLTSSTYGWVAFACLFTKVALCPRWTAAVAREAIRRGLVEPVRRLGSALVQLRPQGGADWLLASGGVLLFGYSVVRAARLSFTGDESLSYLQGVRPGLGASLLFQFVDANNHVLNTVLMFVSSRLLGPGEVALRLPNLLAHLAYILATLAIVRRCRSSTVAVSAFVLLNGNPFMLDFFSLARGYGLALAFQVLSLHEALAAWENQEDSSARETRALWLAVLATLSNLAFLNYYVALLACFGLKNLRDRVGLRRWLADRRAVLDQVVVLLFTAGFMIQQLHRSGRLYYGGLDGFWVDTVGSLIQRTLYGAATPAWIDVLLRLGLVMFPLVALVQTGVRRARPELSGALALLLLAVASTVLQHHLLGIRYLQGRTALLFLPLFFILVMLTLDSPSGRRGVRTIAIGFLGAGLALAMLLHDARTLNLSHTFVWSHDADTERMMEDVRLQHERTGAIRLGATWFLTPSANYYRITSELSWMPPVEREEQTDSADWLYRAFSAEEPEPPGMRLHRRFPVSGNGLWVRSPPVGGIPPPAAVW